jgi:hypothetical protein
MRMPTRFWIFAALVVAIVAFWAGRPRRHPPSLEELDRLRGRGCL